MSSLKFIFRKLLEGEVFGIIDKHRQGGSYFWEVLSADNMYIRWRHYGESANKTSVTNLKWILTEIFKMTPEEFLFTYTTYNEWKRINNCYQIGDD